MCRSALHPFAFPCLALASIFLACGASSAAVGEHDRLAEAMGLRPGFKVADVGAGRGRHSEAIAQRVGPTGHVWATEVDEKDVERLQDRFHQEESITVIEGGARDTGLPEGCCDAILLRLVYHHFTDPPAMRASLRRSLKPGGRLVVVDIEPQASWRKLEGVPERDGHGISIDDLVEEMTGDGFAVVESFERWPGDEDHYCVVFRVVGHPVGG